MNKCCDHACTSTIKTYLEKKKSVIKNDWKNRPIVLGWLNKSSMTVSLSIMDKKVKSLAGFKDGKINEWFLSGDRSFYSITAERYIIDYLKSKNPNLIDNFSSQGGTDGILHNCGEDIGIEVTTLNGFIADSIFQERLLLYFKEQGYELNKTCEITYDYEKVNEAIKQEDNRSLYSYIEQVGCNIVNDALDELKKLNVTWEVRSRQNGCIIWERNAADNYPTMEHLTRRLISSIEDKKKRKQLSRLPKNIVFVGANHCGPENYLNPRLFQALACDGKPYQQEIDHIQNFLSNNLPKTVIGICYYIYSLEQEGPFYNPLRIFWRNINNQIDINL